VALVDIRRGTVQVLSDGRQDESPDFAPNGSMIIYATRDAGRGVLAAVSTDGRVQQRIAATEGEVREPVWSPYSR
jgi:TolB protein